MARDDRLEPTGRERQPRGVSLHQAGSGEFLSQPAHHIHRNVTSDQVCAALEQWDADPAGACADLQHVRSGSRCLQDRFDPAHRDLGRELPRAVVESGRPVERKALLHGSALFTFTSLLVVHRRYCPQSFRRLLRRDVPLWHGKQLVPDHEFAHGRRPQQRWVEVRVQYPFRVFLSVERRLVEAHRVREGDLEQVIVSRGDLLQDPCQAVDLTGREVRQVARWPLPDQQAPRTARLPKRARVR